MMNQWYTQSSFPFNSNWAIFSVIIISIWTLFWKGYSLWTASKNEHKIWFVILLVCNTVGILEIIYVFFVAKKKWADIKGVLTSPVSRKKRIN